MDLKFDIILTSETIYNSENHVKVLNVLKNKLKPNGIVYLAGKTYYFGVGGSIRQFEMLLMDDKTFKSEVVWRCTEGVQREILKIKFMKNL